MTTATCPNKESGIALILALLLLMVMTLLGVTAMSSVAMQERMSGNMSLQALAFEAASAGISDSLSYGLDQENWPAEVDSCRLDSGWTTPWPESYTNLGTRNNVTIRFQRKIDCYEDEEFINLIGIEDPVPDKAGHLVVTSQGQAVDAAGNVLAVREIEVRVENRGGDTECAFRVQGDPNTQIIVDMPESNQFNIDGGVGGCPISTSTQGDADAIIGDLECNNPNCSRVGNYQPSPPGIHAAEGAPPWNNPLDMAEIANGIKQSILAEHDISGFDPENPPFELASQCGNFYGGNVRVKRQSGGGGGQNPCDAGPEYTEVSETKIEGVNYVAGDYVMGGSTSGSGVLIVEGNVCWAGTADFDGVVIALGGNFAMKGGGQGETTGTIYLTNLLDRYPGLEPSPMLPYGLAYNSAEAVFAGSVLDLSGGGNHSIAHSCATVWDTLLNLVEGSCLPEGTFPEVPDCSPDGLGKRQAIASWRENIGWR